MFLKLYLKLRIVLKIFLNRFLFEYFILTKEKEQGKTLFYVFYRQPNYVNGKIFLLFVAVRFSKIGFKI